MTRQIKVKMVDKERAEQDPGQNTTEEKTTARHAAEAPQQARPEVAASQSLESPVELDGTEPIDLAEVSRVAQLEAEIASLKDQLLRAVAETENIRRRSQRERADAVKYAAAPMVKDLLAVADNLERALGSVPEEAKQAGDAMANLLTGIEMTERELQSVLQRHSIERLDPVGQKLNPHEHEAMFEVPDPNSAPGTVVQVIQQGYKLHDRLLRPARVGIARSEPQKAAAVTDGVPDAGSAGQQAGDMTAGEAGKGPDGRPGQTVDTSA